MYTHFHCCLYPVCLHSWTKLTASFTRAAVPKTPLAMQPQSVCCGEARGNTTARQWKLGKTQIEQQILNLSFPPSPFLQSHMLSESGSENIAFRFWGYLWIFEEGRGQLHFTERDAQEQTVMFRLTLNHEQKDRRMPPGGSPTEWGSPTGSSAHRCHIPCIRGGHTIRSHGLLHQVSKSLKDKGHSAASGPINICTRNLHILLQFPHRTEFIPSIPASLFLWRHKTAAWPLSR